MNYTSSSKPAGPALDLPTEYLTFCVGREQYGIDLLRVQEIRSYERPTRLVQMPDFVKGVIDLRGRIVPIIDLRMKLHCADVVYNEFTVIIVLDMGATLVGAVVDSVADVVSLAPERVKAAPNIQNEGPVDASFVKGIADVDGQMLILMDIVALLGRQERVEEPQMAVA